MSEVGHGSQKFNIGSFVCIAAVRVVVQYIFKIDLIKRNNLCVVSTVQILIRYLTVYST